MPPEDAGWLVGQFVATADMLADARAEVDRDMAREVMQEAAILLHNGMAFDGLDDHDVAAIVAYLCRDLGAEDPGQAVRSRSVTVLAGPACLHDPAAVSGACLIAATILQL